MVGVMVMVMVMVMKMVMVMEMVMVMVMVMGVGDGDGDGDGDGHSNTTAYQYERMPLQTLYLHNIWQRYLQRMQRALGHGFERNEELEMSVAMKNRHHQFINQCKQSHNHDYGYIPQTNDNHIDPQYQV